MDLQQMIAWLMQEAGLFVGGVVGGIALTILKNAIDNKRGVCRRSTDNGKRHTAFYLTEDDWREFKDYSRRSLEEVKANQKRHSELIGEMRVDIGKLQGITQQTNKPD